MKLPTIFRTASHQRFAIKPRYYDPIKEEIEDFKNSQPLTFESNPLEYILQKYPSLDATMVDLMTPHYRDYISGVFVTAPKPTTFRIVLHNGQEFYLIYGKRSWIAQVQGKKYYLLNLTEEERAAEAIARILRYGEKETEETAGGEAETEIGTETPPAETTPPAEEETPAEA